MYSMIIVFVAALAVAQGGYLAHNEVEAVPVLARTTHLQGPSASARIIGNDGHEIVGHAPGGSIVATEHIGGTSVGYSAPVIAHQAAYVAPAHAAPVIAHKAAYAAPSVIAHTAPIVAHSNIQTYASPAHNGINPFAQHADFIQGYTAGSGVEGQWVPDNTEKLYDDGSYKGEIYHH